MIPHPCTRALASAAAGLLVSLGPGSAAWAQDAEGPPRWSVFGGIGIQLPATMYDDRVAMRLDPELFDIGTEVTEKVKSGPLFLIGARYRAESSFSPFASVQVGAFDTEATFVGGREPPETDRRRLQIAMLDFGVSLRLSRWAGGRGFLEYEIAPSVVRQTLDLSRGHRDTFAKLPDVEIDGEFDWTERKWTSWALKMGVGVRVPVGPNGALSFGAQHHMVPIGTAALEAQDRDEVRRMTGRAPSFLYSAYTSHYSSVQVSFEYTVNRQPPRRLLPVVAFPPPDAVSAPSTETREAVALALRGDTAAALSALRARTTAADEDASAWRELALIEAAQAEADPSLRDVAWTRLQRAVNMNPADPELLSAYGRLRSIMQRSGNDPARTASLAMSSVVAVADPGGRLSLSWNLENLQQLGTMGARYRVQVQVLGPSGDATELRPVGVSDAAPSATLVLDRLAPEAAVSEHLELQLDRAPAGAFSVRLRVTDLATGQAVERTTGFEIR